MAHAKRKNSNSVGTSGSANSWGGWFVKCDIPKEHMSRLQAFEPDYDRLLEWEAGMAQQGFKISVSYKSDKATFVCSLTDMREDSETYKATLSAFGPTYWGAKLAVWWKHEEILGGVWKDSTPPDSKWG